MIGWMKSGRFGRYLALVLAFAVTVVTSNGDGPRVAQAADESWQSPFVIQNVDSATATAVQVDFISLATGSTIKTVTLGSLAPGQSAAVRPHQLPDLPAGKYSAVVSADRKIAAIVNQASGRLNGSYVGGPSYNLTGSTVSFPNIVRNYAGWNSPFYVQNAGSATTNVTVRFYRFDNGSLAQTISKSLGVGQSFEIDPATTSGLTDGTQYSVVASSSVGQPLVGVVNQIRAGSVVMTYDGFTGGGTKAYLPNITRNYLGWNTPFIVQNVGSSTTNVTVRYYRFSDGGLAATDGPHALGPGLSRAFRPHATGGLVDGTQYSVVVESSGQPIVALVNEESPVEAMSYRGFVSGGTKVNLPNITRNYADWNTPFIVQNVGSSSTNITVRYYRFSDGALAVTDGPHAVGPGISRAFRAHWTNGLADGTQYSVVVESSSQPIVSVVNEHHTTGDAMAYEGVNP